MVRLGGRRVRGRRQMVSVHEVGRRTAATAVSRRRRRRRSGTRRHAGNTATEHHVQERFGVVERTQLTLDQLTLFVVVRVVHLEHAHTHTLYDVTVVRGWYTHMVLCRYCSATGMYIYIYITYYYYYDNGQSSPFGSHPYAVGTRRGRATIAFFHIFYFRSPVQERTRKTTRLRRKRI